MSRSASQTEGAGGAASGPAGTIRSVPAVVSSKEGAVDVENGRDINAGTSVTPAPQDSRASVASAPRDSRASVTSAPRDSQASVTSALRDSQASVASAPRDSQASVASAPRDSRASVTSAPRDSRASVTSAPRDSRASVTSAPRDSQVSVTSVPRDSQTSAQSKGSGPVSASGSAEQASSHHRVSIQTPSMQAAGKKGGEEGGQDGEKEEETEQDQYELAEERHRALRERLLHLTQPRASILSERGEARPGASEQRSIISQYLRQRDPRLFISSQRRVVRSFLPPIFRSRFAPAETPQRAASSQRRLPSKMAETQRTMERTYSTKKHRMPAEQELEDRILRERCQLPMLSRASAHCHRSEMKHNFCIDVLERGCHQTHTEMFHILRRDEAVKAAMADPPALIEYTPHKLQKLKQCLVDMEEAVRKLDYMSGYASANDLAFFFLKEPADLWLANHFFDKCLEFGKKIDDDGKMRESEAHCNVGIMNFFDGNIDLALTHLEKFRRLSYKQVWETIDNYSYYRYSCLLLQDVYLSQAVAAEKEDLEKAFKLYLRASVMANQAQNMQAEAMAQYNLGEIQEKMCNWQNALRRYDAYLRLSDKLLNFKGVCTGCFKVAKCHEAMDKLPLAVDNLKRSEHIARGQHLDEEIIRASSELGHIYLSMGKNDLAFRQFMQAYQYVELSENVINDHSYVASAMVGISSASRLLADFNELVYVWGDEELERVLAWKTAREGMHVEERAGSKWI